jgi:fused signal recognition particle receptor
MKGMFQKFRQGLQKTQNKLVHEIKRIVSRSAKLEGAELDDLEAALLGADLGPSVTQEIISAIRKEYETAGRGQDLLEVARGEIEKAFTNLDPELKAADQRPTVVSIVGVNGTGKTTTTAKLAHLIQSRGQTVVLAACDTFRAAAVEQLKLWGGRLNVPVIAGSHGADPASVAHDAVSAAISRNADYLLVDTAGRLHTKSNLMQELQKLHRVIGKKIPNAPHEVLLVLDATTGMNAMNQAREFHKAVPLTGLIVTKLDGTSKAGMIVPIHKELGFPIKFIGLGEQIDDLQPFNPRQYAEALFAE